VIKMKKDITDIIVNDDEDRLVQGYASVEIVDRQNEIVPVDAMEKAMLKYMERGGLILYGHENKPVGKVLQWEVINHPDYKVPAVKIVGVLNKGFKLEDEVWDLVKNKQLKGFSIGGAAVEFSDAEMKGGQKARVLKEIELSEISLVSEPANQGALITEVSIAKEIKEQDNYVNLYKGFINSVVPKSLFMKFLKNYKDRDKIFDEVYGDAFVEKGSVPREVWTPCFQSSKQNPDIPPDLKGSFCGWLFHHLFGGDIGEATTWALNGAKITPEMVEEYLKFHEYHHNELKLPPGVTMRTFLRHTYKNPKNISPEADAFLNQYRRNERDRMLAENRARRAEQRRLREEEEEFDDKYGKKQAYIEYELIPQEWIDKATKYGTLEQAVNLYYLKYGGDNASLPNDEEVIKQDMKKYINKLDINQYYKALDEVNEKIQKAIEIMKPFAGFKNFKACLTKMKKEGYNKEVARKICGKLRHKYEKGGKVSKRVINKIAKEVVTRKDDSMSERFREWLRTQQNRDSEVPIEETDVLEEDEEIKDDIGVEDDIGINEDSDGNTEGVESFNDCVSSLTQNGLDNEHAQSICGHIRFTSEEKGKINKALYLNKKNALLSLLRRKKDVSRKSKGEMNMDARLKRDIRKDEEESERGELKRLEEKIDRMVALLERIVGGEAGAGESEEEYQGEEEEFEEVERGETEKANIAGIPKNTEELPEDAVMSQKVRANRSIPTQADVNDDLAVGGESKYNNISGGIKDGQDNPLGRESTLAGGGTVRTTKSLKKNVTVGKRPEVQTEIEKEFNGGIDMKKGITDILTGRAKAKDVVRQLQGRVR